jgi:DNA-binding NarL/FixJ family response regulator
VPERSSSAPPAASMGAAAGREEFGRMNLAWPLVGRDEELALIASTIAASEIGAIMVSGEAGVGKSRVVGEALNAAERAGLSIERVLATNSAASIPFGAFSFPGPEKGLAGGGRTGVIRKAASALVERAAGRRLIVGVDDADRLDEASAALVRHLAETGTAFVIACQRTDATAPDAVEKLWSEGLAERIELPSLSRGEADELLEQALGSPAGGETRQRIWEATEGNPLYVRELVLGAMEAGSLVQGDGVWRWTGSVAEAPRLIGLIEGRIGNLADDERQALELVAIAEAIPANVLIGLAGGEVLEATERRGLLEVRDDGDALQVRLSHPLYGEVLRARAPTIASRETKRRLAEAFEEDDLMAEESLRIATWRVESGTAHDPDMLVSASRRARAAFDLVLAERLARAALKAGGGWKAEQALAKALVGRGEFIEAETHFDAARLLCTTDQERVQTALDRATNLFWHLGRDQAAMDVIEEVEDAARVKALRDSMTAARASFLLYEGNTASALELATELIERAGPQERAAWAAAMTAGWGLGISGRVGDSLRLVERFRAESNASALDHIPPVASFLLRVWRCLALGFAGRFDESLSSGQAVYERAVGIGAESGLGMSAWGLGFTARLQGTAVSAARWLAEAVSHLREVDTFGQLSFALGELAQAEALLGNLKAAEAALEAAESARINSSRMDEYPLGLARAWVAAARGETSAAIGHALETARITGEIGQHFFRALALHDALRLGETGVIEELEDLVEIVDGALMDGLVEHARAVRSRDATAFAAVSSSFEACGAVLYAAEAAAEAADAYSEEGRADSARREGARARRLLLLCEGATTPLLAGLELPELSRREREVASLAAAGLSNAQIAERLTLSVRTVENHLHTGYGKLGVGARAELPAALGIE